MNDNLKKYLPYIEVLAGFLGFLLILFLIFDNWLLPSMVKDKKIVEVPKLMGMKLDDATKLLVSLGLEYNVVSQQYNENFPKDYVINQNPSQGIKVKESRKILLTVSKGIESVNVPYLIGKDESRAKTEIMNLELSIGNIIYEVNDSIPRGIIIRQNPRSGSKVGYNSNIDLVISSGIDEIIVPNLTGLTFTEAQIQLEQIGLRLGEVTYQKNETYIPNTIVNQSPQNGESVSKGTLINITITK
jgi:serine/threonine-protein kinase